MKTKKKIWLLLLGVLTSQIFIAQTSNDNYVREITYLDGQGQNTLTNVTYHDGLGRPMQTATQGVNTTGKYIYQRQVYDARGRVVEESLPTVGGTTPEYIDNRWDYPDVLEATYNDSCAYQRRGYDALDRPTSIQKAGETWNSNEKRITVRYVSNAANSVKRYEAPMDRVSLVKSGYYAANSLYGEETIDEDGHKICIFKDKLGRKVLERLGANNDTYFVYNDLGQLRYVLSPEYQKSGYKDQYAYEYRYDDRGRCVKKILPSCEYEQYWYDRAGRRTFMQDANLRERGLYRFFLYDNLGRLTIEGVCLSCQRGDEVNEARYTGNIGSSFCQSGYELKTPSRIGGPVIEKVYYYDDYAFLNGYAQHVSIPIDSLRQSSLSNNAKSLPTGTMQYAGNGELLLDVVYYDEKGRQTQTRSLGLDGRYIKTSTAYTYWGEIDRILHEEYKKESGQITLLNKAEITNNHDGASGKLLTTTLKAGTESKHQTQTVKSITYDDLGRVSILRQGDNAATTSYEYNLHGWITRLSGRGYEEELFYESGAGTPLYNGNISSKLWTTDNGGLYRGYKFTYDHLNRLTRAQYGEHRDMLDNPNRYTEAVLSYSENGVIKRLQRHGLKNDGVYGKIDNLNIELSGNKLKKVTDDALPVNRLNAADFKDDADLATEYRYNANGALISDANKGIASIEYDLRNCPKKIQFTNGNSISYVYSPSGQKLRSIYVTAVDNVTVPLGETVELDAEQIIAIDSTDYSANLIYENGSVKRYLFDGGYVDLDATSTTASLPRFRYYTKDYQGNNRVVVDETGTILQTTHYYPFGGVYADAGSGSAVQPYKYGGKELDRMHGLNWYDFGARSYDATLQQWTSIDPKAEDYYHLSPYTYCANNPVAFVDPNGQSPIYSTRGDFLGTDDLGIGGDYIVMDGQSFTQGMSHADACEHAVLGCLPKAVETFIKSHHANIPNRPDYDGFVTALEGIRWAKSHPGALGNPTPDNMLYINTALLDFGNISDRQYIEIKDKNRTNLFKFVNLIESAINPRLRATVYALGRVSVTLIDEEERMFEISNDDATNYDWNEGGGGFRELFIKVNNFVYGINPQMHGFQTYYYGVGILRQ
ncbi:MAG: RHS repeat-associated core domain-containing protein [Bacteroidales bacterium]|nr:RHS repeat-associated core domain-containing protein [Bacteroidales bacterium]